VSHEAHREDPCHDCGQYHLDEVDVVSPVVLDALTEKHMHPNYRVLAPALIPKQEMRDFVVNVIDADRASGLDGTVLYISLGGNRSVRMTLVELKPKEEPLPPVPKLKLV
jgi:hypothetical protein